MTAHRPPGRGVVAGTLVGLLVLAALAPPVAAQSDAHEAFVVELAADGTATITVTFAYDLTDANERDAFRTLVDDGTARDDLRSRFSDRLQRVAADAAEATDRELVVRDASIDVSTADGGDTGVVALSVVVAGLAVQEDGQLVLTEPFASGYEPDRLFVVVVPDGYAIAEAAPAPDERDGTRVAWAAGTSLDGFRVVAQPTDDGGDDTGADGTSIPGQPGFGVGIALLALLAAVTFAARRDHP